MARPAKISHERIERIANAVRAGSYYEPAARSAGICYETFRNWMVRGEKAHKLLEEGEEPPKADALYVQLFQAITRAESEAEVKLVALWMQHCPTDWRAARDLLARRYRGRWTYRETYEIEGGVETSGAVHIYLPDNERDPDPED